MFSRPKPMAISVVCLLLFALSFAYGRSEATTQFTTEVRLGNAGTGAQFEPVGVTMSRLQDDILEYLPAEITKSRIVYVPVNAGTVLRLRTLGVENDRTSVLAVHQYIADELIKSTLPLATAERIRLQSQLERVEEHLRAIDRQQTEHKSFRADNERIQTSLTRQSNVLRSPDDQPQQNIAAEPASYFLLRDIQEVQIISAHLSHAQSRFEEARLDRDKADLQAEQSRWTMELSRWEGPFITRLAVAAPYVPSLARYLGLALIAGALFSSALIWLFSRLGPSGFQINGPRTQGARRGITY